jgi:hypothetical protein
MLVAEDLELELLQRVMKHKRDPLGYTQKFYPWGKGDLEGSGGPRTWQAEVHAYIRDHLSNPATRFQPCRVAVSSGHGIGKSAFMGQITNWAMSTCEDCKETVTAGTGTQLATKTVPEIGKWFGLGYNHHWFDVRATSIRSKVPGHEVKWRSDFVTWSEHNTQTFAGLHNEGKRLVLVFDEASTIADKVWEVAEGALTDENTEIIWLAFGNPERSNGWFYDIVFGRRRSRWKSWTIDSRTVEGTNKKELDEWAQEYGEDSDFFRVRARGLPPRAASAQFIDQDLIDNAQKRTAVVFPDEPLVAGVDFAWGGADDNVIRFRCGLDAQSIKPIKVKGEFTRDPAVLTGKLADILAATYIVGGVSKKLAMLFLDSAGIAAPVEARLRQLGHQNIVTVNFGAHSPDTKCAYFRDFMWQKLKEWLRDGAIDNDPGLAADLAGPCLVSDKQQRIKLEDKELMKKRGLDSPDDGDALALTFAQTVATKRPQPVEQPRHGRDAEFGWMAS